MTHSQPIMNVAVDDSLLQREKGMASVQLQNVTKAWGEVVVSKDINLDIHEGEFVVFVGPSGCGKSTLLRMIAGLETITSGDLFIGEKRMNDTPPAERGVGMVFQSYALYPHLSVAENMSFGLKLAGAKKEVINQRVNQVAEVLQLAHLLDRKPPFFCGKQHCRVIGIMRHSRSSHRLVYRKLCTGFGSQTTELHRLWFDICSVVLALFRSELLCGNHHRNFYHRYRHAMHPVK